MATVPQRAAERGKPTPDVDPCEAAELADPNPEIEWRLRQLEAELATLGVQT